MSNAAGGVTEEAAFAPLDHYISQQMRQMGCPGVALALTDHERTLHVAVYGLADRDRGVPVTPETLFSIGSIGKSMTAALVLRAAERGLLALDAPVTRYLPWFNAGERTAAITVRHLLTHSAGLVAGPDLAPDAQYEVWQLRAAAVAAVPGAHYHYSNVGYKALGFLLEELYGLGYADLLRREILEPCGLSATAPVITNDLRPRLATGYVPLYDDRPPGERGELAPAPWVESLTGDGCLATTPEDLARWARLLLNRGTGPAGRRLSEASFAAMVAPAVAMPGRAGRAYGYGLVVEHDEERVVVGHGGTMIGHFADLRADLTDGLAALVMINGPGNPHALARFALATLRAARRGEPAPPIPPAPAPHLADYGGGYAGEQGDLVVEADGDRLALWVAGRQVPLAWRGRDTFYADDPAFDRFLWRFHREEGVVVEVGHGAAWYRHERYAGPPAAIAPAEWEAYCGHYRSWNPWFSNFRVVWRKDSLLLILPAGQEQPLTPVGDATFRPGADPASPEWLRFDTIVGGQALRASYSGAEFYRTAAP